MKKIIAIIISVCFFVAVSEAQVKRETNPSQTTPSNIQKNKKGKMMKELNLSKEQRSQMKEFHQSMKQQKETITSDNSLTDAQKQDKLKNLKNEQREKMKSILTPEQLEKLKEEKKRSKE